MPSLTWSGTCGHIIIGLPPIIDWLHFFLSLLKCTIIIFLFVIAWVGIVVDGGVIIVIIIIIHNIPNTLNLMTWSVKPIKSYLLGSSLKTIKTYSIRLIFFYILKKLILTHYESRPIYFYVCICKERERSIYEKGGQPLHKWGWLLASTIIDLRVTILYQDWCLFIKYQRPPHEKNWRKP